jgi:hypothetical protein
VQLLEGHGGRRGGKGEEEPIQLKLMAPPVDSQLFWWTQASTRAKRNRRILGPAAFATAHDEGGCNTYGGQCTTAEDG